MAELIRDGKTGFHFRPGDAADLSAKLARAFESPEMLRTMRRQARAEYSERYTPERNYESLMAIYERAIAESKFRRRFPPQVAPARRPSTRSSYSDFT